MKKQYILGIDPSLTSTGLYVTDGEHGNSWSVTSKPCGQSWPERSARYNQICAEVGTLYTRWTELATWPLLCVIEHYSFASQHNRSWAQLGELGHAIRSCLSALTHDAGRVVEVAPTALKKFACGKGGGKGTDKTGVALAVYKRWGVEFDTDDETDAYVLARIGLCLAGLSEPENEAQQAVIKTLTREA